MTQAQFTALGAVHGDHIVIHIFCQAVFLHQAIQAANNAGYAAGLINELLKRM